jgi:hypothetical protein
MPENPVLEEDRQVSKPPEGWQTWAIMLNLLKRPIDWEECRSLRIMLH